MADKKLMLMKTPLKMSYACSMESQINLVASKGEDYDMFLRVTKIGKLQAYPSGKTFDKGEHCGRFSFRFSYFCFVKFARIRSKYPEK